jgi:NAD+ kinase
MKICIHGRYFNNDAFRLLNSLITNRSGHGFEFAFTEPYFQLVNKNSGGFEEIAPVKSDDELSGFDIFLSLGGDGTLLETITITGKHQHPILGINTGRLGFLTSTGDKDIEKVMSDLYHRKFTIDERSLIRLNAEPNPFGNLNFALNEIAVLKSDSSSMITVNAYIDDHYLNSYWADGLVVSTPTGSTGYSLSCGGPVVVPRSNNFIITPVSVHNLSVRPIVVSDRSDIRLEVESRSGQFLVSLDSRSHTLTDHHTLHVARESFSAKLIKFGDYNYFNTLRQKLNWGLDVRN